MCTYVYNMLYMFSLSLSLSIYIYIYIYVSARVRAYDDRAQCRNAEAPNERAYCPVVICPYFCSSEDRVVAVEEHRVPLVGGSDELVEHGAAVGALELRPEIEYHIIVQALYNI